MMSIFMFASCLSVDLYTYLRVYLNFLFDHIAIRPVAFHPFCHSLQRRLNMSALVAHHCADDNCLLPLVLQPHLRHRDVELTMQTRDQWLDTSALFFQGSAGR